MKKRNLTDNQYGRLIVIGIEGYNSHGEGLWKCKCDCGKISIVFAGNLIRGHTRSCGCLQIDTTERKMFPTKNTAFNRVYRTYKHTAKRRNLSFTLSPEEFREITQKVCFYCSRPPQNECKSGTSSISYWYSGIDRIDNTAGYSLGNTVPCCYVCNRMKGTMTQKQFKIHLLLMLENWGI